MGNYYQSLDVNRGYLRLRRAWPNQIDVVTYCDLYWCILSIYSWLLSAVVWWTDTQLLERGNLKERHTTHWNFKTHQVIKGWRLEPPADYKLASFLQPIPADWFISVLKQPLDNRFLGIDFYAWKICVSTVSGTRSRWLLLCRVIGESGAIGRLVGAWTY